MKKFKEVAPLTLTHIQTDNGSEFAKHFEVLLEKDGVVHFHTYPRCPKMNSEIERFNRTLSDAFISWNRKLLAHDIEEFNRRLMEWLLWYNTRRPHWTLGLISPLRYIVSTLPERECHMIWTSTSSLQTRFRRYIITLSKFTFYKYGVNFSLESFRGLTSVLFCVSYYQ
jgi:hypothetical protein